MSLKPRLRRLAADIDWLKTWGALRRCEILLKIFEIEEKAYARNPVRARELGLVPRGRKTDQGPASPAEPTRRDAALPAAPPGEGVHVTAPPPVAQASLPPEPAAPPPPEPEQPPVAGPPPPDLQIRPVTWRRRGPQDDWDDNPGAVPGAVDGRCLTDDDPLDDG